MTRFGTAALAFALAAQLVGPAARPAHSAPTPTLVTLKNGLRVVLAPDSAATATDVAVWYAVSIDAERPDAMGARHLLERLMFRGTPNVGDGEFARRIAAEGGSANTSLRLDYSAYFESIPAEALDLTLRLEADRMAGLKTSPEAFEEARRACLAEVRGRASRPLAQRAIAQLGASVYEGLPYAGAVEGDEATLQRLTPASLDAWRRDRYGAANVVLSVVGRFDAAATLDRIRALFEPLPRGKVLAAGAAKKSAAATHERRSWQSDAGTPVRLLLVGWRAPGAKDPDMPALELLTAALGFGESSMFSQAMTRTWGTASFAQCGLDRHRDASMFWTMCAVRADADSAEVERQVIDQVGSLARDPLPADALDRLRASWITSDLVRSQTVRARAQALGDAVLESGDLAYTSRRLAAIDALTPADLQRLAGRLFVDSARSVLWIVPAGGAK